MNETNDALVLTPNAEAWEKLVASAVPTVVLGVPEPLACRQN